MNEIRRERPTAEVWAVWAIFGLVTLAVVATYWRLPAGELYHTSVEGLAGGLGRALVVLNFPVALAAIGVVGALLERGASRLVGAVAIALGAVTAWPGVVDQDDLDAKLVNAVPALGVALAVGLTIRARPLLAFAPRRRGDPLRITLGVLLLIAAIPWWFAELGFYAPDPFLAEEVPPGEGIAAVHAGHHHGTDGTLLAGAGLLLSRIARSWLLRAYVALMLVYGFGNALQDFWLEQVVKRGTTDVEIPSLLVPELGVKWAVLLAAAAVVYVVALRRPAR